MSYWMLLLTCLITSQICSIYGQTASTTIILNISNSVDSIISQIDKKYDKILVIINATSKSPIENFVAVTQNELAIELLIMTNGWQDLEKYSTNIPLEAEGRFSDCPDLLKNGILMALNKTLEGSTLYIFTDDPACIITEYKEVRSLSILKQIQMVFINSNDCEYRIDHDFQNNYKMGDDTVRAVLPISKSKASQTLEYVMESIKNKQYLLTYEKFSNVRSYKFNFSVNNPIDDVLIFVAAQNVDTIAFNITAPNGCDANTTLIFLGKDIMIVRLTKLQTGVYTTVIFSESETYIKVVGRSNIKFQCGFSNFLATSLIETARRPASDGNAFLSIQICTAGINLTTARIEDMSGNALEKLSLRTPTEDQKFFISKSFDPPKTKFRIAVDGYEVKTKAPVSRKSAISFERRNPKTEKRKIIAPKITIEEWPKIITKYNVSYQLKCKAQGYPSPYISWHDKASGNLLPAKVLPIEEPYEYVSILDIGEPYKNTTYECRASNSAGDAKKDIQVEVYKYLRVVQASKGILKAKYEDEVTIYCKIDAYPPVTVIWYKGNKILTGNSNTVLSNDNSSVTIKQINFETKGTYKCEVTNELDTKKFYSHLILMNVARPKINRTQGTLHVLSGNDAELVCQITKEVIPKAKIYWIFPHNIGEAYEEKNATGSILRLKNVTGDQTDTYVCIASNYLGTDYFSIELIVDYPPISTKEIKPIQVKVGNVVKIPCDVTGVPSPKIEWFYNSKRLKTTSSIIITTKNSLMLRSIKENNGGNYTCIAYNKYGSLEKTFNVEVYNSVYIKTPAATAQSVKINESLTLNCQAFGYPEPKIQWIYDDFNGKFRMQNLRFDKKSKSITLLNMALKDEGFYSCIASNKFDSKQLTYEIIVKDELDSKE